MIKLDVKDKRILSLLDRNARTPISLIAKSTRLNKDVVRYRIKRLEDEKVISGYYTIIDTNKLGFLTFRIYFDCARMSNQEEIKFIDYLDKEFKAGQIFRIDGDFQIGILTWEKSIFELENKLKLLKVNFGAFISNYNLAIFTNFIQFNRKYLIDSKNNKTSIGKTEIAKVDGTDMEILKAISKDARITSVDIGEKLKVPQRTVIYRIRELEKKNIILGYKINITLSKIKRENYFLEIFTFSEIKLKEVESFCQKHPDCIGVDYILYGADIEIELEVEGKDSLLRFISELKDKFKHIKKIRYWSTLSYEKINYLP